MYGFGQPAYVIIFSHNIEVMYIGAFIPAEIFPRVFKEALKRRQEKAKLLREQLKKENTAEVEQMLDEYVILRGKLNKVQNESAE